MLISGLKGLSYENKDVNKEVGMRAILEGTLR